MAWLRLDDGFADHPKVLELSPLERWEWVRLLCYCARRRQDEGTLTGGVLEQYELDVATLVSLGLLDELEGGGWVVHDWAVYNGARTGAERMRAHRERRYGADYYGEPVGRHGGRRGTYARESRTATSSDEDVTGGDAGVTFPERNGSVSDSSPSRARLPQDLKDVFPLQDVAKAGEDLETVGTTPEGLEPGGELLAARLLEACGDELDESKADYIRGAVLRLPESVSAGVLELVQNGRARDRPAYVLGALKAELGARGLG